jgi:hypothetical protein
VSTKGQAAAICSSAFSMGISFWNTPLAQSSICPSILYLKNRTCLYLISRTLSCHTCLASWVRVRYFLTVRNSDPEPSPSPSADRSDFLWHNSGSLCVVSSSSSPSASLRNVSISYEELLLSCNREIIYCMINIVSDVTKI